MLAYMTFQNVFQANCFENKIKEPKISGSLGKILQHYFIITISIKKDFGSLYIILEKINFLKDLKTPKTKSIKC